MLGALVDSSVYKTYPYTTPQNSRGWFNVKFAAFVIAVILAALAYSSFSSFLGETVGSWFGWKSRGELIADNKQQGKVIDQVIEANHGIIKGEDKAEEARKAVDDIGIKVDKEVKKIDRDTKTRVDTYEAKAKDIEKTPELTEAQKDKEVAQATIDAIWVGYCQIDPSADPSCAKVLETPKLKASTQLSEVQDMNPIFLGQADDLNPISI